VAAVAHTAGGRLAGLATGTEVAALAFALAALVLRWYALVPWAVLAGGAGYLIGREGHAVVDGNAAIIGVLLLLGAELASWSMEHDRRIQAERAVVVRRALTLAGLAVTALIVNLALLGTASLPGGSGVLITLVGIGAAILTLGVVVRLVRTAGP
jgi:hypothetical protein